MEFTSTCYWSVRFDVCLLEYHGNHAIIISTPYWLWYIIIHPEISERRANQWLCLFRKKYNCLVWMKFELYYIFNRNFYAILFWISKCYSLGKRYLKQHMLMPGSIVGIYLSASMSVEVTALTVISPFQFCIMYCNVTWVCQQMFINFSTNYVIR
jgi:hypothetical protein